MMRAYLYDAAAYGRDTWCVGNPLDTPSTQGRDTKPDQPSDEGMRGRDGHADLGREGEAQRRGDDGADHAQHQHRRVVRELHGVDDAVADRVGHAGARQDRPAELHDGGEAHGSQVVYRAGGHGRGPRVGDIVGSWRVRGEVKVSPRRGVNRPRRLRGWDKHEEQGLPMFQALR